MEDEKEKWTDNKWRDICLHTNRKKKNILVRMEKKKKYPIGPEHYTLYEEVGQGVSASVHRALCKPFNEVVAIKILDFERDNCDLNNISREAQTMILVDHPNVLKSHCSFVSDHNLWVVMPFMAGGSCLHILKAAYPDGFEEVAIATILREILKGLEYLHHHGHIHRDVKAGNILIDSRGAIKLGDFGVSACLFDNGDRQRMRNTFVGTPCWMAPEVMEQLHGYDFKADIWSFGITALELAHGHAPFSKYPPMKVLLMTLQNAPPGLDYERDRKFSKSFKQMIASCLVKDPSKRPSAKKLLKHSFFKQARSNDYIARTLLEGLPALGDRIKELKRKEEYMLAQKKMPDGQKEEISQNEYKRGISGWNFNIEDMKAQASLIQDVDDPTLDSSQLESCSSLSTLDPQQKQSKYQNLFPVADMEDNDVIRNQQGPLAFVNTTFHDARVKNDKSDDDSSIASHGHELHMSRNSSPHSLESNLTEKPNVDIIGRMIDPMTGNSHHRRQFSTGSFIILEAVNIEELDEKVKAPVVQQKGRFKVTSENVDLEKVVVPIPILQKSHSLQVRSFEVISMNLANPLQSSALPSPLAPSPLTNPSDVISPTLPGYSLETILAVLKQIVADFTANRSANRGSTQVTYGTDKSLPQASEREVELTNEISDLLKRLVIAQDELQKLKLDPA
ncbi:serine/threonine-protein kinase BLUS1 [Argentina anserina]|uniref:serine/threonine-protein kinase BLUS1 n=1 Tax=Argentina anserina TaxID=57926 RepID=UPI0021763278|nr:serine/threonine-protein kinase BLUS1 [Potentilla anserina]